MFFAPHPAVCLTFTFPTFEGQLSLSQCFELSLINPELAPPSFVSQLKEWLQGYAKREKKAFPITLLPLEKKSRFAQAVLQNMHQVLFGTTTSYGELAQQSGSLRAFRAVGTVCNKNPYPLLLPCHRIVGAKSLGGFAGDIEIKKRLLDYENDR